MAIEKKITQIAHVIENRIPKADLTIIKILQEKRQVSLEEIVLELAKSEETKKSKSTVSRRISLLEKEGLVIKVRDGKSTFVKWVGGVSELEQELQSATSNHIKASILAEYYDSLIIDPFALFSLMFENNCWEIIVNLKEGLNDIELSQRIGAATPLDTVRRVLVVGDAHNLVKVSMIRNAAGDNIVRLFEPLYKIDHINKDFLEYLTIIRGLASAISYKMEGKESQDHSHLYSVLLEPTMQKFFKLHNKVISEPNKYENEILTKVLLNYDFAPDMDRIYRHENWREKLKNCQNLQLDSYTNHIVIKDTLYQEYKKSLQ